MPSGENFGEFSYIRVPAFPAKDPKLLEDFLLHVGVVADILLLCRAVMSHCSF